MLLLVNIIIVGIIAFFCYSLETIEQSDVKAEENKNKKPNINYAHNNERYKDV